MCGRYLLDGDFTELYSKYILSENEDRELVRGEVSPTDAAPVVVRLHDKNKLIIMRWGLEGYQKNQRLINARSETLLQKKRFSRLMDSHRCIVPASAFFEWQKNGTKKIQRTFKGEGILSFAALYEPSPEGSTFTIITMEAMGDVATIHDRMPVIMADEDIEAWIRPDIPAGAAYEKLLAQRPQYYLMEDQVQNTQLTFL